MLAEKTILKLIGTTLATALLAGCGGSSGGSQPTPETTVEGATIQTINLRNSTNIETDFDYSIFDPESFATIASSNAAGFSTSYNIRIPLATRTANNQTTSIAATITAYEDRDETYDLNEVTYPITIGAYRAAE